MPLPDAPRPTLPRRSADPRVPDLFEAPLQGEAQSRRSAGPEPRRTAGPRVAGLGAPATAFVPPPALWLCLRLPRLALEVFGQGGLAPGPAVVAAGRGRAQRIAVCNAEAEALGVHPGMRLGAAHALGSVRVLTRDVRAETRALEALAVWAVQFTPWVSPVEGEGLLLEVAGSLGLFGGVESLVGRVREGCAALGYDARLGLAPTPTAALLFARAGTHAGCLEPTQLAGALSPLPLDVLDLPEKPLRALRDLGLARLGDVLRLPRDGLARRLEPGLLRQLDQALGRQPDPRRRFEPPARFESRVEFGCELFSVEPILRCAGRLLEELCGFLRARGAGAQRLEWTLESEPGREVCAGLALTVGLLAPSRDPVRLMLLTRERLERQALRQPVRALRLRVEDPVALQESPASLLRVEEPRGTAEVAPLVERLRARLGVAAVRGLALVADHRPEHAWRHCEPGEPSSAPASASARPLWLLAEPQPLSVRHGRPRCDGPLEPETGPERIESGWWEQEGVARDYYVARNPSGERFWVYRELRARGRWFLHGVFE